MYKNIVLSLSFYFQTIAELYFAKKNIFPRIFEFENGHLEFSLFDSSVHDCWRQFVKPYVDAINFDASYLSSI